MKQPKAILKDLFNNNAVYEAIYCQIVSKNDYIIELKENKKSWQEEKKSGYYTAEQIAEHIASINEDIKTTRKERKQLQKAFYMIYGDPAEEYND